MDWTPSPAAMARKGKLHFNVCGIEVNDSGISLHEWHSEMGTGIAKGKRRSPPLRTSAALILWRICSLWPHRLPTTQKSLLMPPPEVKNAAEQVEQGKNTTL